MADNFILGPAPSLTVTPDSGTICVSVNEIDKLYGEMNAIRAENEHLKMVIHDLQEDSLAYRMGQKDMALRIDRIVLSLGAHKDIVVDHILGKLEDIINEFGITPDRPIE